MRSNLVQQIASLVLFSVTALLHAETPSESDLRSRLTLARAAANLSTAGLKPWYTKLTFKMPDTSGKISEEGVLEEWWAGVSSWRVRVTSPSYKGTVTQNGDHLFRTVQASPLPANLMLIKQQVVDPLPDQDEINHARLFFQTKTLGSAPLDCIMVAPASAKHPPFTLYPTYCFDIGSTRLRATLLNGTRAVVRNKLGTFQGKTVALILLISNAGSAGSSKLETDTDQLTTYVPTATEFDMAADQKPVSSSPSDVSSEVAAGSLLTKILPIYPVEARRNHTSGYVKLTAIIGTDGYIRRLEPLSSPDEVLTTAAVAAVRQWAYKPYLVNGEPTEVRTTVTVHFQLGY